MTLVDLAVSAVVEDGPLPLKSSVAGTGRVARTISRLWVAHLPLEGSMGAVGGLVVSGTTPWATSLSFSTALTCSAS